MDINKCQFCEKYYPSSNGVMKCNSSFYDLKLNNPCKEAINRMMTVLVAEKCKKEDSNESNNL